MAARPSESIADSVAGIKSAMAVNISASDQNFQRITRGIYVGVAGNVVVQFCDDNASVTLIGLAAGIWHPIQAQLIVRSGTTATNIVAGF